MSYTSDNLHHWQYFLSLERSLHSIKDYTELHEDNFDTYSIELAKLLLSTCSQIEAVLRIISDRVSGNEGGGINDWHDPITNQYNSFKGYEIIVLSKGLSFKPWENWRTDKSPECWGEGYNKLKHDPEEGFKKATLQNFLNAVSALFIAVIYLYENDGLAEFYMNRPLLLNIGHGSQCNISLSGSFSYVAS